MSINWNDDLGQRTLQRIAAEMVIWLTTISPSGVPQPRPVWYVWDGSTFLVYSAARAKKLIHIAHNPHVALHFNTDAGGEDIQVILGKAVIDQSAPPPDRNTAYVTKYREGIYSLAMDEQRYAAIFTVALRIEPFRLRGLEPISIFE